MKLGLIGHPLGHSWSPVIHAFMIHEDYQKWDLQEEELDAFIDSLVALFEFFLVSHERIGIRMPPPSWSQHKLSFCFIVIH